MENELKSINQRLNSLEITPVAHSYRRGYLKIMRAVKEFAEGATAKRIREKMDLDQRTVNNYLVALHELGYLKREINLNVQDNSRYIWQVDWEKIPDVYKRRL